MPKTRHYIPESSRNPYRLGRHLLHDPRSLEHPAEGSTEIQTIHHRHHGSTLNQGDLGSCTGNACAQAINTAPVHKTGTRLLTEHDAVQLYSLATHIDDVGGSYPPDDTGSNGLSVAKAALTKGYISKYTHAFGIQHVTEALMLRPLILGTVWLSDMFNPSQDGYLTLSGDVAGGHEWLLLGYHKPSDTYECLNSWGGQWGVPLPKSRVPGGGFLLHRSDLELLLTQGGDAVVLVK